MIYLPNTTQQRDNVLDLCEILGFPREVTNEVVLQIENLDLNPFETDMNALLSIETANTAYKSIVTALGDDANGYKLLTFYLTAALKTRDAYAKKGINDTIFVATLKGLTRFLNEHHAVFGEYGFDRGFWAYRHLSLNLFRLGLLEFEMLEGKLSVHIPSDVVMTREALVDSYNQAKLFFAKHFGSFTAIECNTWLLSPALRPMLPENSKILNFQADYEILSTTPDGQNFLRWVYWLDEKEQPDLNTLPENTSLQRAIKLHLLNGGKIGNALGRYVNF